MRPIAIPAEIQANNQSNITLLAECGKIRANFQWLLKGIPEVSVIIPAYNEEASILKTLRCLSESVTHRSVEIIVVNNNSTDNTEDIVNKTGAKCIREAIQGITPARNAGLAAASGKYILNADADTIYPPGWIEAMTNPLDSVNITAVYGRFSFLPTTGRPRLVYFLYEYIGDFVRWYNKRFKEEAVNVYGFNSGFKREQGLQVDGFDHPPDTNEDGWLALKLRNKGFGKLHYVTTIKALVWTSDRRLQMDGGLRKGFVKRFSRFITKKTGGRTDL